MHLAVLTPSISRSAGGLFHSVRSLSKALKGLSNTTLSVLALTDRFSDEDLSVWHPLQPELFQPFGPRAYGYATGLAHRLKSGPFDIVHTHGIWQYPSKAATAWTQRTGKPHLISPRGMLDVWALNNSHWKKVIAGWLYENQHLRSAACIHALCQSEADSIRAYGLKTPICIIPNGIDLPDLTNSNSGLRSQVSDSPRRILLFLSRIHPKKGLVNLLKAWSATINSQPSTINEWVLAIAGWDQGGHEAELKQLATELGIPWTDLRTPPSEQPWGPACGPEPSQLQPSAFSLQPSSGSPSGPSVVSGQLSAVSPLGHSHSPERWGEASAEPSPGFDLRSAISRLPSPISLLFTGPLFGAEKESAYRACDAFILPSFSEGLPMAVLEAWAYGKPVLMTPECNLPEGFAANAAIRIEANPQSIQNGLADLIRLPTSDLRLLGAHGRSLVEQRFTWPKIAVEMKSVYDWVLGGGDKPGSVILK